MAIGPERSEQQVIRDIVQDVEPSVFQAVDRLAVAYEELDAEAHLRYRTQHADDEIIFVDDYRPQGGGERQRSIIGLNGSEIYLGLPPVTDSSDGRAAFTASFEVSTDSSGRHLDPVVEPLVIATTLEDLAVIVRSGRAHVMIKKS